jgi:hypothetical protein
MPNHAAYKRADVEDARRGHPLSDLSGYGQERGLEPIGSRFVGHVAGLNPLWEDYVFNVLRGEVVPGRFGVIQHELLELSLGDDGKPYEHATYYGLRARTRMTWKSFLPFGELFEKGPPNEPFAAQAFWVPTTALSVLVPEAALLPKIVIRSKDPKVLFQGTFVDGFVLRRTDAIADELQAALAEVLGPVLQQIGTVYANLTIKNGALGLRVDGFRDDPAELDHLTRCLGALAEALAARCALLHEQPPAPFTEPLPAFDASTHPAGYRSFDGRFDQSGLQAMQAAAGELGMRVEDPVALHRRLPRMPIPGASLGVLAGTLPGSTAFARLTFNAQGDPRSSAYLRRGVITAAREGAKPTPPGGVMIGAADCWLAVEDGLAYAWPRAQSPARLDVPELAERAISAFREAGAADV